MEERNLKVISIIITFTIISLCIFFFMYTGNKNFSDETNNENKGSIKYDLIKDNDGLTVKELHVNGTKVELKNVSNFAVKGQLSDGLLVQAYNSDYFGYCWFVVDKNANVITSITTEDLADVSSAKIKYYSKGLYNAGLDDSSDIDNGILRFKSYAAHAMKYSICHKKDDDTFVYEYEYKYIGIGKFEEKIINKITTKQYKESNNKTCSAESDISGLSLEEQLLGKINLYNSVFSKYLTNTQINDIPNNLKLYFLINHVPNGVEPTVEELKKVATKYFDVDFIYNHEDVKDDQGKVIYKYKAKDKKYELMFFTELGIGDLGYHPKSYFISSNYDEITKLYVVKAKTLYTFCTDACIVVNAYGSANFDDVVLFTDTVDTGNRGQGEAKHYLNCASDGKDAGSDLCSMDIRDAAYKLGADDIKEITYYFKKTADGNYVLKEVK